MFNISYPINPWSSECLSIYVLYADNIWKYAKSGLLWVIFMPKETFDPSSLIIYWIDPKLP